MLILVVLGFALMRACTYAVMTPNCQLFWSHCEQSAATSTSTLPVARLGDPVTSKIAPAVVPFGATLNPDLSNETSVQYWMPSGATKEQVKGWYQEHMTPGADFRGLKWLETVTIPAGADPDWYWCATQRGKTVDVTVVQDGARVFVAIALQVDSIDTKCG